MAERSKAHAWKVCIGQKPIVGSNPTLSASFRGQAAKAARRSPPERNARRRAKAGSQHRDAPRTGPMGSRERLGRRPHGVPWFASTQTHPQILRIRRGCSLHNASPCAKRAEASDRLHEGVPRSPRTRQPSKPCPSFPRESRGSTSSATGAFPAIARACSSAARAPARRCLPCSVS